MEYEAEEAFLAAQQLQWCIAFCRQGMAPATSTQPSRHCSTHEAPEVHGGMLCVFGIYLCRVMRLSKARRPDTCPPPPPHCRWLGCFWPLLQGTGAEGGQPDVEGGGGGGGRKVGSVWTGLG